MHDETTVVKQGYDLYVESGGRVQTFPLFSEGASTELKSAQLPNSMLAIASVADDRIFFLNTQTLTLSEDDAVVVDPANDWESPLGITEMQVEGNKLVATAESATERIQVTIDANSQQVIKKEILKELDVDDYSDEDEEDEEDDETDDSVEDEDSISSLVAQTAAISTPQATKPSEKNDKAVGTTPIPHGEPDDLVQILKAMEDRIRNLKLRLQDRANYKKMVAEIIQSLDKQWMNVDHLVATQQRKTEYTQILSNIEHRLDSGKDQLVRALVAQDSLREIPKVSKANLKAKEGSSIASSDIQEVAKSYLNLGRHATESIELDEQHILMWQKAATLVKCIDDYRSKRYNQISQLN